MVYTVRMTVKRKIAGSRAFGAQARSVALLWGEEAPPGRGPKPELTLARIAEAAVALADREGLEALSMQRLAHEFGFTTMALYRYLPGKPELVDLMIDTAIGPPPKLHGHDWRERLESWARQAFAGFQRHPWLLGATGLRFMGPNELLWMETALGALDGTGLTHAESLRVFRVVITHVRGEVPYAIAKPRGQKGITGEEWKTGTAALVRAHRERFVALSAAFESGAFEQMDGDALGFGLRYVLDGFEALIGTRSSKTKLAHRT
jgi:AcrR family transcriptional regulator